MVKASQIRKLHGIFQRKYNEILYQATIGYLAEGGGSLPWMNSSLFPIIIFLLFFSLPCYLSSVNAGRNNLTHFKWKQFPSWLFSSAPSLAFRFLLCSDSVPCQSLKASLPSLKEHLLVACGGCPLPQSQLQLKLALLKWAAVIGLEMGLLIFHSVLTTTDAAMNFRAACMLVAPEHQLSYLALAMAVVLPGPPAVFSVA